MIPSPRNLLPSLKLVDGKAVHPGFMRPYPAGTIFLVPVAMLLGAAGRGRSIAATVKSYAGGRLQGTQEAGCLGSLQRLGTDGS